MVRFFAAEHSTQQMKGHTCLSDLPAAFGPTLPFCSESSLVGKFLTVAGLPEVSDVLVRPELDAGNGIADIAIMAKRKDWIKYGFISQLKPSWVYPIVALPYRRLFDAQHFADQACLSKASAERVLRKCHDIGMCEKRHNGWIKTVQPRAPFSKIFAIEAKLRDWRQALMQASRYKEFAHQSWVLLDSHYAAPAIRNIEQFERRDLGLLVLSQSGHLTSIHEPRLAIPRSLYRYWYAMTEAIRMQVI